MKTLHIALIGKNISVLAELGSTLARHQGVVVSRFSSARQTYDYLASESFDVAVVCAHLQDCSGLQFVKELVSRHPFINCALVSPLPADRFHDATEGYGVFMQVPMSPTAGDAETMMQQIKIMYQQLQSM